MKHEDMLGREVRYRQLPNWRGRVIGVITDPAYVIEFPDGTRNTIVAHLVEPVSETPAS
jgi:hypothetical protein